VDFTSSERPVLLLTEPGKAVMKAARPARLLLPPLSSAVAVPRAGGERRPTRSAGAGDAEVLDAQATALFEALRHHRLRLAREQGVPPYVVASDRTLRELAQMRPASRGELLEVHGIGQAKAERYGDGFLRVIAQGAA
jgi:ATP-dependent DNA helicase RecQ